MFVNGNMQSKEKHVKRKPEFWIFGFSLCPFSPYYTSHSTAGLYSLFSLIQNLEMYFSEANFICSIVEMSRGNKADWWHFSCVYFFSFFFIAPKAQIFADSGHIVKEKKTFSNYFNSHYVRVLEGYFCTNGSGLVFFTEALKKDLKKCASAQIKIGCNLLLIKNYL